MCADKISCAEPPPADAEAYLEPKRTVNRHFTDEFLEWQARLTCHGDLDERGKNKARVTGAGAGYGALLALRQKSRYPTSTVGDFHLTYR